MRMSKIVVLVALCALISMPVSMANHCLIRTLHSDDDWQWKPAPNADVYVEWTYIGTTDNVGYLSGDFFTDPHKTLRAIATINNKVYRGFHAGRGNGGNDYCYLIYMTQDQ